MPTTASLPAEARSDREPSSENPPSPIVDSPIVNGFALTGVSSLPDPSTHAYRKDLADTALAGRVIASHYADPLVRLMISDATAFAGPSADSDRIGDVRAGDSLAMLDCSRGWAWGYLPDGRVGYVKSETIGG